MEAVKDEPVATKAAETEPMYEDYFGFDDKRKWFFPDNKQYLEFQVMNEGDKAKYQRLTQRDLVLERTSGNARLKVDQGQERTSLLTTSVVGWHVVKKDKSSGSFVEVPFSTREFEDWLKKANPKLVEDFEKAVRKANPWLMAEMSVEDIDREIDNLREMREVAVEREQGEASSSNK